MVVSLFTDRRMIDHQVPGTIPRGPSGLQAILRHLERTRLWESCPHGTVREATQAELLRVHTAEYLNHVSQELETKGGGMLDPDTWFMPGSGLAARLAAGAGIEAVSFVMRGTERRALYFGTSPGSPCPALGRDGFLHLFAMWLWPPRGPRAVRAQQDSHR